MGQKAVRNNVGVSREITFSKASYKFHIVVEINELINVSETSFPAESNELHELTMKYLLTPLVG